MAQISEKEMRLAGGIRVNFYRSTAVDNTVYNQNEKTLAVRMRKTGDVYRYKNVAKKVAEEFINAPSQGKALREILVDSYDFDKNPRVI